MRLDRRSRSRLLWGLSGLLFGSLSGCGAETLPFDELPLRDALQADPEVIAALPDDVRQDLAERLLDARPLADEAPTPAKSPIPTASLLVANADDAREEEGKDAVVLGALERTPGGFALRMLAAGADPDAAPALPAVTGGPTPETRALEEIALHGRGGVILTTMAKEAGAEQVVRVTRWPAGAVISDRVLYVNASWLVAMSALDDPSRKGAPMFGDSPGYLPRSIDGNPYSLPQSVNQCVVDVHEQCACVESNQCQPPPTDPTFSDAKSECAWIDTAPINADAICVLALLSIEQIVDCVSEGDPPCTQLPVTNKEQAVLFAQDELCMAYLDGCLAGGRPTAPSTGGSSGCSDDCDACDSPNCNTSNCNNDNCDRCDSSIGNCTDSCDGCDSPDCDSPDCDSGSCGNNNCKCEVARRRRGPPDGTPWGNAVWLIGPALYIAARSRRRP